MKFILHSDIDANSIRDSLGKPEYSYYFVLKAFRPVLEQLGSVVLVQRPEKEVDPIFEASAARGEPCVFVSFSPPHAVTLDLKCPTVVLFAWEFSTIPDGSWENAGPRDDWRFVLAKLGFAISLSSHTARVVKAAMGADFPIFAIAAPIWDRLPRQSPHSAAEAVTTGCEIRIRGSVIDSADYELSPEQVLAPIFPPPPIKEEIAIEPESVEPPPIQAEPAASPAHVLPHRPGIRYRLAVTKRHLLEWYREALRDLMPRAVARAISRTGGTSETIYRRMTGWKPPPPPPPPPPIPELTVRLSGIVYTAVLNPTDGRKNWHDILTAFCWAFRDVEDATLVLKMVKGDPHSYRRDLFLILARLAPFKCRVVAMDGFLEEAEYSRLLGATSYYVNASNAEGLCLPLMEFMCAGKPVIAPRHTAMEDYIDDRAAFILKSTAEHNVWPHDPRHLYTTMRYTLQWDTLVVAYEQSYRTAKEQPQIYVEMGRSAVDIMRRYCSDSVVKEQLRIAFGRIVGSAAQPFVTEADKATLSADDASNKSRQMAESA